MCLIGHLIKGGTKKHANRLFFGDLTQPNGQKLASSFENSESELEVGYSDNKCPKIAIEILKKLQKFLRPIL